MKGRLLERDLIFFTPGKPGAVFSYSANHYITSTQLIKAQEFLVKETANPIVYVEDRRIKPRSLEEI